MTPTSRKCPQPFATTPNFPDDSARAIAPVGHGVAAAMNASKGAGHVREESDVELGPPAHP